jgi:hypothetical protein
MKKIYSIIAIILVIITISVCGCSSTTTIIQQPTNSVNVPSSNSSPIYSQQAVITTITEPSNQVINAQSFEQFPSMGLYVQAGRTLTLSVSADGELDCFIFTANQFSNWENSGYSGTYTKYGLFSIGGIQVTVQNSDTYYAVLFNNAPVNTVEVYKATLAEK